MSPLKSGLLAATMLLGAGGMAMAQMSSTYDPAQLPATKGKVAQYTLTPRGDVDGLILTDGTEVHVNPGISTTLAFAVHPGDSVTIHGLKARAVPMVEAASITNDASNVTVDAMIGRFHEHGRDTPMQGTGKVKAQLHDPRGEANGVLLEDGTVIRLPPGEATRLASQLAVGQTVVVKGPGIDSPLGKLILARQLGPDANSLTTINAPRPPMHMAGMHGFDGHGPGFGPGGHGPMNHDGAPPPPPPGAPAPK